MATLAGLRFFLRPNTLSAFWARRQVQVGNVKIVVVDLRPRNERDMKEAASCLRSGLERLLSTSAKVEELIAQELGIFLVLPGYPLERGVEAGRYRTYILGRAPSPSVNPHVIACELLGAAAVSRHTRRAGHKQASVELQAVAWEAQLAYLKGFEEPQEWLVYFDKLRRAAA